MGRTAKITSVVAIQRQQRLAHIVQMRAAGFRLREIGEASSPPVSAPRVFQLLVEALRQMVAEPVAEARELELARCDDLLTGVYERAVNGDLNAIDRVLAIHDRRVRLMGLAPQRPVAAVSFGGDPIDPAAFRIEVVTPGE